MGGASPETFSGEAQLKKTPCMFMVLVDHCNATDVNFLTVILFD